jgi:radical SAM protein with 4Fe4S-binding SPASM domain
MNLFHAYNIQESIEGFRTIKIKGGQIDFNGICNSRCWYCPVKYEGNVKEYMINTSMKDVEIILKKIRKSSIVETNFIYTSSYNEFILHPQLEEILTLFRKYNFQTMILSNGTPLTPERTDLILKYYDVIYGVCLNIPDIDKALWSKKTGFSERTHATLMKNLEYLNEKCNYASIQVNTSIHGVSNQGFKGSEEDNQRITRGFNERFPNLKVSVLSGLSNRASILSDYGVLEKKHYDMNRKVVGCSHSSNEGGRVYGWFHINPKGEMFICCDDFKMKYSFGSLLSEQSFDEIWCSLNHALAVRKAQSEICLRCDSAMMI